jgi:hypothetical protein
VIEEVLSHRQVLDDRDPERREIGRRSDAGQHEQLWRAVCAGGQDDLTVRMHGLQLAVPQDLHADGAPAIQDHASGVRVRDHREVRATARRRQERRRAARAPPIALRHLVAPHALLRGAVEVGVVRVSRLLRSVHPQVGHRQA